MAEYVRVRRERLAAVRHPDHGEFVVPNPAQAYRSDDPLVVAHPWLFATDAELAAESGTVEQASAAPGERRTIRRGR